MGAKRRQQLKKQGRQEWCPDIKPNPTMNGKPLEGYDHQCYMEGWDGAETEYQEEQERAALEAEAEAEEAARHKEESNW